MTTGSVDLAQVLADGFAIARDAADDATVTRLRSTFSQAADATIERDGAVYARRQALDLPVIREWAQSDGLALARQVIGIGARPVRGILFDKRPEANWPVAWHQDVTIAVRERMDLEGYGPWSVKRGVPHVQPPSSILAQMITVRLHLDDCPASNGALRVIPGSHLAGKLDLKSTCEAAHAVEAVICEAEAGDALLMRPLLLHNSSPSVAPTHRRVVHIEYADGLPGEGLAWAEPSEV